LNNVRKGIPVPTTATTAPLAALAASLALLMASSLLILPKGLSAFAALLFICTVWRGRRLLADSRPIAGLLVPALLVVAVVLAVSTLSMHLSGQGWRTLDNLSRLLLLPWCAWIAYALAPSRLWLWSGACIGVVIAFALALLQSLSGVERAGVGSNPIVFANAVLVLLVLVVFCRPGPSRWPVLLPVLVVFLLGTAAMVLSGSRGVLPGLVLLVLVATVRSGRALWPRLGIAAAVVSLSLLALWMVPALSEQTRLGQVVTDVQNYQRGHIDSPIGARLEFLSLAARTVAEHPWTGVGIDRFDSVVEQIPVCSRQELGICQLGHAHNDIAEWSATMGVPGLLALLLLYAGPGWLFVRQIRRSGTKPVGAAWAGLMIVCVHVLSGQTQSMFAHALTASAYAIFVGLLLGIAAREQHAAVQRRSAGEHEPGPLPARAAAHLRR
jgi:O-antigen ligase